MTFPSYSMAVANADGQRLHHQEESYAAALRTVARLTLAAVVAGADEWLDRFVNERLLSETAADHPLAITKASCRPANAQSTPCSAATGDAGSLEGRPVPRVRDTSVPHMQRTG